MTTTNFTPAADAPAWPPAVAAHPPAPRDAHLTVGALLGILHAGRWLVLGIAAVAGLTTALVVALLPRTYTSAATFVVQGSKSGGGGLAGLASQFGVSVGAADVWQQPNFYIDLLNSREVLEAVARDSFCDPCAGAGATRPQPLAGLLEIPDPDPTRRTAAVADRLRRMVATTVSQRTGLVTLKVRTEGPALSQQIADRFLDELTRFNLGARRAQASAERQFAERRMQDIAGELRSAEERLESFYRTNRSYQGSPELRFEEARLQREVVLRQDIYTSLARAYEQARIDELRDLPVLVVVDHASRPPWPDERKLPLKTIFGAVVGLLVGTAVVLGRALRPRLRLRAA